MITARPTPAAGALLAGTVCLIVLSGVLVIHAWPLWTGASVVLRVVPVDPRDLFRGEYVRLSTPATRLLIRDPSAQGPGAGGTSGPEADPGSGGLRSEVVSSRLGEVRGTLVVGSEVYVQLEPGVEAGASRPVSISSERLPGAINLRGRVTGYDESSRIATIDYGLDRFYMEEGAAKGIEDAIRDRRVVQMEIAVAASGRARIRRLLVDGRPAEALRRE